MLPESWRSIGKSFISEKELEKRRQEEKPLEKKLKTDEKSEVRPRIKAIDIILQKEKE